MKFFSSLKRNLTKQKTLIVIVFFFGFGAIFLGSAMTPQGIMFFGNSLGLESNTIELREEGFSPSEITIQKGETVTFTNLTERELWPATDAHPTHTYYPGSGIEKCSSEEKGEIFDACEPILPAQSWSFTFQKVGVWRFHNHLSILETGKITVLKKGEAKMREDTLEAEIEQYCNGEDNAECFDARVRKAVKEEGVEAGYALLIQAFEDGNIDRSCHWTAHTIGAAAYELFREGEEVPISKATSYCGYGFYHEFFEKVLRENPDSGFALSFCDRVEEKLGKMGLWNCYHGIGHGYTKDPPLPETWGNFNAMVQPGIEICEGLFSDNFQNLNLCLTGVYTVPTEFADEGEYGLYIDPQDPFAVCREQPYRYKKACYGEFAPKLGHIFQWDLSLLSPHIEGIEDPKLKRLVTWVVPSVMVSWIIARNESGDRYIESCQNTFDGGLEDICLGGLVLGFMTHGEPEKQHEKLLEFCASDKFVEDNQELCYNEALRQMRQAYNEYPEEKIQQICSDVPVDYQTRCEPGDYLSPYDDPSFDEPPQGA